MKRQIMKKSEARILVYLNSAAQAFRFVRKISSKLEMDYGYLIKILLGMKDKQWVNSEKSPSNPARTYYYTTATGKGKLGLAKKILLNEAKQEAKNGRKKD